MKEKIDWVTLNNKHVVVKDEQYIHWGHEGLSTGFFCKNFNPLIPGRFKQIFCSNQRWSFLFKVTWDCLKACL